MAVQASRQASTTAGGTYRAGPADVFVVFGITGDLAKVMTFHSLYRRCRSLSWMAAFGLVGLFLGPIVLYTLRELVEILRRDVYAAVETA